MRASRSANHVLRGVGDRLSNYRSWIACCLSRGQRAPLGESDVAQLVDELGEQSYAGGTYVFNCGDKAARVHVVRTGTVELSRHINGRRVALQILHPGDVFGDVPLFLGEPEAFDARALEDCTILSLDSAALASLLRTRPKVARRWLVSMAERMAGFQARLVDLLAGPLEAQLASILMREAEESGEVKLAHRHLSEMLGVPESSAQRVLKSLEKAGLIELRYRRIVIADRAGLSALVDADGVTDRAP